MEGDGWTDLLRLSHATIAVLVAAGMSQAVMVIAGILLLRRLIDDLQAGVTADQLAGTALIYVGAGIVLGAARAVEYTVAERAGYRLVARLRLVLHRQLLRLPARSVNRSSQGAVLLRFTGDLSTLRTWISRGMARGIAAALVLGAVLVSLLLIEWTMALAAMAVLALGSSASSLAGLGVRRSTRAVRWRRSLLATNVAEQIRSLAVVQVFGRGRGEHSRLTAQNDDLLGAQMRAANARGLARFLASITGSLVVGAVLLAGLLAFDRGRVGLGGLIAALAAARLVASPVRTLGRSHEYWQAAQVSKRKLADFMARERRPDNGHRLRIRRGRIDLQGVTIEGVVGPLDLTVDPGDIVALTGHNGAGKSTLLSLVGAMTSPDAGRVLIDGVDLATVSPESVARNIGSVGPDLPLMRGTLLRNLTYRYGRADDTLIEQAVMSCRVDEVIDALGGGYQAWLVEGGQNLSAGHRQRVALARAVLGTPPVLLLDEPTAAMDPSSKEVFRRMIARYPGTVLLATHDPAEALLADQVLVMHEGRFAQRMSAAEYRTQASVYRRVDSGRSR